LKLFHEQQSQLILVPDTNSLIQFPDPISYRKLFNEPFTFLITPTVLTELDKLKINHRNEEFRNKVKSVIKRLKGFRNQGNVLEGVTVDKTITIKMTAVEPNFSKTLKWLDPANEDDRIIAGTLELQVRNPADRLVLMTSDINLQNKAQAAMLNYEDTDDLE
jgi:predicted ribonuclease YlaK